MFLGVGAGAYVAGIFHLVTHAFFKALLFLGSGCGDPRDAPRVSRTPHSHDDAQDMRNMGGLRQYMPWTFALMWIATLAIAGIPPFAGLLLEGRDPRAPRSPAARGSRSFYLFWLHRRRSRRC